MEQISARPAATIVVIRDHSAVLEILMLRRSPEAAAAPGAHVFPGGGVDDVDALVFPRGRVTGLDDRDAARRLSLDVGAVAYYCAALRELFEEAGLLVAVDDAGRPLHVEVDQLTRWRSELAAGRLGWLELLEREGLRLDLKSVQYLAHWVTPDGRPRRFDTRFFVAAAPLDQLARADDTEIVDHVWTTAADALDRQESGEWRMLVPTVRTLRVLSSLRTVDEVLEFAKTLKVERIHPREIERDGRTVVVVPGEPGYVP